MRGQTQLGVMLFVLAALTQIVNITHVDGIDRDFSNMILEVTGNNDSYTTNYTIVRLEPGSWIQVNVTVPDEDYGLNVLSTTSADYAADFDPSIIEISYMPGLEPDFSNLVIQFIDSAGNVEEISYSVVSMSEGNWAILGLERAPTSYETISILAKVASSQGSGNGEEPVVPDEEPPIEPNAGPVANDTIDGSIQNIFDGDLQIIDKEGKKIKKKLTPVTGHVKVNPESGPLKQIIFKNLESKNSSLRIDDVPEDIPAPENVSWVSVYAIDPSALDFTSAVVTVVAKGNSLYKCAAWDFDSRTCTDSNWKLLRTDLIPGREYTFTLTPNDPAFGEANLTVINLHSTPAVGGNWTIYFNTSGTALLTVKAVNGTIWDDVDETGDLRFLELRCGATLLSPNWNGGQKAVKQSKFQCNETGSLTSKVLTTGSHILEFKFDKDVKYAYNDATNAPVIANLTLNSTSGMNYTNDTLTLYWDAYDLDIGDNVYNITNWNVNGLSILELNLPFEANGGYEGSTAIDYSTHGRNGAVSFAPWMSTMGHDGWGAYDFSNGNEYIQVSSFNTNPITVSAWIFVGDPNMDSLMIVDKNNEYELSLNAMSPPIGCSANNLCWQVQAGPSGLAVQVPASSLSPGAWHHVVGTYNYNSVFLLGTSNLYVDGAAVALPASSATAVTPQTSPICIGGASGFGSCSVSGMPAMTPPLVIDQVQIYNRELTQSQITELFNGRTDRIDSAETALTDVWQGCITPNDGSADGNTSCSNTLTVTQPDTCPVISSSGTHTINNNIVGAPNVIPFTPNTACVRIISSDVIFDCNGYNVSISPTPGFHIGVFAKDVDNITLRNCPGISGYVTGVVYDNVTSGLITNSTVHSSFTLGMYLKDSEVLASDIHLYDNPQDLKFVSALYAGGKMNLTNIIFDNPAGDFQNYTNLSLNETVPVAESNEISINWTAALPTTPPGTRVSFADKHLNITRLSGTVSLEDVAWYWTDAEVTAGGYNESKLELWKYSLGGWNVPALNDTPDITANTISLSNHNPTSTYSLFQENATENCPHISSSGTYQMNLSYNGSPNTIPFTLNTACILIGASNVIFDCDGYNITNNGTAFSLGIAALDVTNVTIKNCPSISQHSVGIRLDNVTGAVVTNSTVHNSTANGIYLSDSATLMSDIHLYNNTQDLKFTSAVLAGGEMNLTNIIFDNPAGDFQNFTNLSLNETVLTTQSSDFYIKWTSEPPVYPSIYQQSFENKHIDITRVSGTISIEGIVWHWTDSESASYDESILELWKYIVGSWTPTSFTLDETANTITLTNFNPASTYSLLNNSYTFPVVQNVTLNSTNGTNLSAEDLTLYWDVYDLDNGSVYNITNWLMNGTSILELNLPFEANGGSEFTTTTDYSTFGRNGIVSSAPWMSNGGYDGWGTYDFSLGNEYIQVPSFNTDPLTVSAWLYTNSPSSDQLFIIDKNNEYELSLNAPTPPFPCSGTGNTLCWQVQTISTGVAVEVPSLPLIPGWHHLVGTYDSTSGLPNLYIDGVLVGLPSGGGSTINPSTDPICIGAVSNTVGSCTVTGSPASAPPLNIDQVQIYNRELSAQQITALFNSRNDLIVSQETAVGDGWQGCVTPNDGTDDGNTSCSNILAVKGVENCPIITSSGLYQMTRNYTGAPHNADEIFTGARACVKIAASDVIYDCDGYSINDDGTVLDSLAIVLNGSKKNITVKNCANISGYTNAAIYINESIDSLFTNNTFYNSGWGYYSDNSSGNTFTDNTFILGGPGIYLRQSSNNNISGFNATGANSAISLFDADSNTVSNGYSIGGSVSMPIKTGSGNNTFTNITTIDNYMGFELVAGSDNTIQDCLVENSTLYNYYVEDDVNAKLLRSRAYESSTAVGFYLENTTNSALEHNLANGTDVGIIVNSNSNITLLNSTAVGSYADGFNFAYSDGVVSGVEVYDSLSNGLQIANSDVNISDVYLRNNSFDFYFISTLTYSSDVRLTDAIFDNPAGGYLNYTNLSLYETSDTTEAESFAINWTMEPATPLSGISFEDKYLNISQRSGSPTIESITWQWTAAEASGYTESDISLWMHNGSWYVLNTTPDVLTHSISLANLAPGSTYGLLESNVSACPTITSSGIHQVTGNLYGAPHNADEIFSGAKACVKIAVSDVIFDCDGYSITNDGTIDALAIVLNGSQTNVTVRNCANISQYHNAVYLEHSTDSLFTNNTFYNASVAYYVNASSENTFTDNVFVLGGSGVYLRYSDDNNISGVNATGVSESVRLYGAASNTISDVYSIYAAGEAIIATAGSSNNTFTNVTALNGQRGLYMADSNDNTIQDSVVANSTLESYYVLRCDNTKMLRNTGYGGNDTVFNIYNLSSLNLSRNIAYDSPNGTGFYMGYVANSIIEHNEANDPADGFLFSNTQNNTIQNITAQGCFDGIKFAYSDGDSLTGAVAYNNTQIGLGVTNSDVDITDAYMRNNEHDFYSTSSITYQNNVNLTGAIFDNPAGGYLNYTNLSLRETSGVADAESFAINWTDEPASPPSHHISFANKHLNISQRSGTPSIEQVIWHWTEGELGSTYDESKFGLWKHSGVSWSDPVLNSTPDTGANTLSLTNLNPASTYSILENSYTFPVVQNVTLNSTYGTNYSTENLTLYWDVYDLDNDSVYSITNWYVGGSPIMELNMPFEANGGSEGTSATDYSNNSRHGIVNSAGWSSSGGHDGSAHYSFGAGSSIDVPTLHSDPISVSQWIQLQDPITPDQTIIERPGEWKLVLNPSTAPIGCGPTDLCWIVTTTGGNIGAGTPAAGFAPGQWYHIVGTFDPGSMDLFVDGTPWPSAAPPSGPMVVSVNLDPICIGSATAGGGLCGINAFNGDIDQVQVYNWRLNPPQITELFNQNTDKMSSSETLGGDVWMGCVTPNDGTDDGNTSCSNSLNVRDACINPTDEMFINSDTTLCPGTFIVDDISNDGAIKINASDIMLTCNNTVLDGDGTGTAIRILTSKTNVTIQGCNFTDYDYGITVQTDWDTGLIANNSFNDIDYYGINFPAAVSGIKISNNSFYGGSATSSYLIYAPGADYLTISDNYFGFASGDYQIYLASGSTYNNITNNTFYSIGSSQHSLYLYSNSATNNNNVWKNTFLGRGIVISDSIAGRTEDLLQYNSFCVNGLGNAYFNMSSTYGLERPLTDCGPFPNISVISVNQSYDGNWAWNGTTSGTDVNLTSIRDAVANAPHGALVNVTTSTTQSDGPVAYFLDNVTLDCNGLATIDNDLTSGSGLELRYLNNFTAQNCSFDSFRYNIYTVAVDNSSFLNNNFSNAGFYGLYMSDSDYNLVDGNRFMPDTGQNYHIYASNPANYNVFSNNYFEGTNDYGIYLYNIPVVGNNITGNVFNISTQHAIRLTNNAGQNNNNIWKNKFYHRGIDITESIDGRDEIRITSNNFCVDDGSGAVGNAYLSGSGYERPSTDCGPFPNITSVEVDPAYNNGFVWGGTVNGTTVNMSNVQDALANVPLGGKVNVSAPGTFTEGGALWYIDNATLDCNGLATMDNGLTTGYGLYLRYLYNFTAQNCAFNRFQHNIYTVLVDNSSFLNNNFSNAGFYGLYMSDSDYNLVDGNRFMPDTGQNYHIYASNPANYNVFSNNYFEGTNDYGIYLYNIPVVGNNITGNVFNISTQHAIRLTNNAGQNNNNIWKNKFYHRGIDITESIDGRDEIRITSNNFCVDDGSGAVGNAYLSGSGYERPSTDCGPFPNITSVEVDPAYNNGFVWGGTVNGTTVNMSNVQDALANVPLGGKVNVSAPGTFTQGPTLWYIDNATLDCNGLATIDNDLTTGAGLELRYLNNFTVQNCIFDDFQFNIQTVAVDNSSFLNNNFSNGSFYGLYMSDSDYNLVDGNRFMPELSQNNHIHVSYPAYYNVFSNNYFQGFNDYGINLYNAPVVGNNITGNVFNISAQDAIRLTNNAGQNNNLIWANDFVGRDSTQVDAYGNNHFNYSNIGNYWRHYDSQGEGCVDLSPIDGICDSQFEVDPGRGLYDYYPQTHQFQASPDCGEVLNSDVILAEDLKNSTGGIQCPQHGLIVNSSIVLDGAGYSVNGYNSSKTYGIYAGAFSNVTIRNLMIDPYEYGILLNGTTNSVVENNSINDTAGAGIWVTNSANNNTLRNNTLTSNSVGVNITGGTNTLVYYNDFRDSTVLQAYSDSATNHFNITNGTSCALCARGNNWSDIFFNYLNITDSNDDEYGDTGTDYPYSSVNGANVSSNVIDYGPWVGKYSQPVPPIVENITLNSTLGTDTTSENLTVYYDVYDSNALDSVKNITNWYVNGSSILALNLPFEADGNINGNQNSTDYSGYGNNGNVTGASWNPSGGYDGWGAYSFDGTNDWYISLQNGSSTDFTTENFTVMAWVYPRTNNAGMIYDNRYEIQGTDSGWMFGLYDNGAITFDINGDNDNAAERSNDGAYSANNWQHIAVVKEGTTQTYYVNGTNIGSDSVGTSGTIRYDPAAHHLVGKVGDIYYYPQYNIPNRYFNGTIDELKVFNRALSDEQIQAIFDDKTDLIVSNETSLGDVWQACITPNDGTLNGNESCSNNLTIIPPVPCVNLSNAATYGTKVAVSGGIYYVNENTTLCTGTYQSNQDLIRINASNIYFDCDNSILDGFGLGGNEGINITDKDNVIIRNCNVRKFGTGIYLNEADSSTFINNTAYNNIVYGFYAPGSILTASGGSEYVSFINNSAYSNQYGFRTLNIAANFTNTYARNHSSYDIFLATAFTGGSSLLFTNLTIDNPTGGFKNYTTLDLQDTMPSNSGFAINWTTNSSALLPNLVSFNEKFVDISKVSVGINTISSINWTWPDSAVPGYNESRLEIWEYGTSWANAGATLYEGINTLSMVNLTPSSDYAILENNGALTCVNLSNAATYGTKVVVDSNIYYINEDTTLCTGTYSSNEDAIRMNASNIYLDCNSSIIDSSSAAGSQGINITDKDNVTIMNCNVQEFETGIYLAATQGSIFINNTAYNNTRHGFSAPGNIISNPDGSTSISFINNTAYGNGEYGFRTSNIGANFTNSHVYNHPFYDVSLETFGMSSTVLFTNLTIDNPSGGFKNYTTLDIQDTLSSGGVTRINWTTNSTALPAGITSFNQKFVNISGTNTISSINWTWPDGALPGYNESKLQIWEYSTSWADAGATLYEGLNTLSIANLSPSSDYAVVENNITSTCVNLSNVATYGTKVVLDSNIWYINENTTLCTGTYSSNEDAIRMNASNIYLDCNNSIIDSSSAVGSQGINITDKDNVTIRNCNVQEFETGIYLAATQGSIFINNTAYNNTRHGFSAPGNIISNPDGSTSISFINNTAYGNGEYGFRTSNIGANFTNSHVYNHPFYDVSLETFGMSSTVLFTNLTIDNPSGGFKNYTTLDIQDTLSSGGVTRINWTTNSTALPAGITSFNQKFVNISGTNTISSINWTWPDGAVPGYNESRLQIWKYSTSWADAGATLYEGLNTLSIANLSPSSDYAIVESNITSTCVNLSNPTTYGTKVVADYGIFYVNENTTLCTDTYQSNQDLIRMNASNIYLDCDNSILDGFGMGGNDGINITDKDNVTIRNCNIMKFGTGIYIDEADGSTFINNTAHNNIVYGFNAPGSSLIATGGSTSVSFINNSAYSNQYGFRTINIGANFTNTYVRDHLSYDLLFATTAFGGGSTLLFTNLTIDNPTGGFENYTTLDLQDTIPLSNSYAINWTTNSSTLPPDYVSFRQKFVNITSVSGSQPIDNITWRWTDSEVAGYDDSQFEIFKYNGTWQNTIALLNSTANTLTLANVTGTYDFAILQSNLTNCPIIASPGIYQMLQNHIGSPNNITGSFAVDNACIVIASSNVTFDCFGYNLTTNNTGNTAGILVNGTNMDYSNITIRNCSNITGYSYGVSVQHAENITIANMTLFNSTKSSLMAYMTSNLSVQNTSSSNNTEYGISLLNSNNTDIIDSNSTINGAGGALISLSENVTIDPSYFCNNTGSGIIVSASNNTVIDDSVACNNTEHGVLINNSLDTLINSSSVYNNTQYGVYSLNSNGSNFNSTNITNNTVGGVRFDAASSNADIYSNYICFNGFDITNQGTNNTGTMDRCDSFLSWTEDGHAGCEVSCTDFWHRFFGNVSGSIILTDNESGQYFYEWNASAYNVYFSDVDSSIDWVSLQAIGRNTSNGSSTNDFTELDIAFNGTTFIDNIESAYSTDGSSPIETQNYQVFGQPIVSVPVANSSTQNTTFQTGILWDTSDGGTEYSNTLNQSTVWMVSVNTSTADAYGTYDYLIQVPYTLADYEGGNSQVGIWMELQ